MLRRQPTAIKLTPEDVLHYDDDKKPTLGGNQNVRPGPLSAKTKDERIGVEKR